MAGRLAHVSGVDSIGSARLTSGNCGLTRAMQEGWYLKSQMDKQLERTEWSLSVARRRLIDQLLDVCAQMDPAGTLVAEVPDIKTQIQHYQDHFATVEQSGATLVTAHGAQHAEQHTSVA